MGIHTESLMPSESSELLSQELKQLISGAKERVAVQINSQITMLYWQVGHRINSYILQGKRAEYGEQIITNLAKELTTSFGRGWSQKQLHHCMRFSENFSDFEIVSTASRQLSWSHFLEVLYLKESVAREFYVQMSRLENWSVRTLRKQIDSLLFERTALAKQPQIVVDQQLSELQQKDHVTPALLLKDPYVLDFLQLNDRYVERDLEDAILREMEQFLLELGVGFSFVARQKRIQVDNDDFYIDLLFYNRKLKRLVAIDLKIGRFKAEYKGQMELYLRWLAKYEQESDEQPPLGIILCTGKKEEQIELLELGKSGIHVAEYLTLLPPKSELEARLHQAIEHAKAKIEQQFLISEGEPDGKPS